MTHNELQDLLPLYVLGGLDPEAAAEVERHLAETCDACSTEVRVWQEVLGLIPFGLTPPGPSPAVKERLMMRVRRDAKVVPLKPHRRSIWMSVPLAIAAAVLLIIGWGQYQDMIRLAAEQETRVQTVEALLAQERATLADRESELQRLIVRLTEHSGATQETGQRIAQLEADLAEQRQLAVQQAQEIEQREQRFAQLQREQSTEKESQSARAEELSNERRLVAALETEVADLKAALTHERARVASTEQELRQFQTRLEQQRVFVAANTREVEQLRDALNRQKGVIEVLSAPGLQVGKLGWAKRGVDSQGHVLWNDAKKTWLFYSFGMPEPPPDKEYQVWFMTEEEGPVSAGLFRPDQAGAGLVVAKSLPQRFGRVTAAAVTLEPAGGLPKPSGEMYLRGAF